MYYLEGVTDVDLSKESTTGIAAYTGYSIQWY
jgi:hypothetical protein